MHTVLQPAIASNRPPSFLDVFATWFAWMSSQAWLQAFAEAARAAEALLLVGDCSLTGLRTEVWRAGSMADQRERDLRQALGPQAVTRTTAPDRVARWRMPLGRLRARGPAGESLDIVVLRFRPAAMGPPPPTVAQSRARSAFHREFYAEVA